MTQELCDKIVSEDLFMLQYWHDKYKTQKMYDKSADLCVLPLKFVLDWFVPSKMIKKNDSVKFSNSFGNSDSDIVAFFSKDIG